MAAKKKTIRTIPQERTPMPEQDPQERARNFEEVTLGYTARTALREAERCLHVRRRSPACAAAR